MRKFLIPIAMLAVATPVSAAPPPHAPPNAASVAQARPVDPRDEALARSMPDPREIEEMGRAATRASEAILDMPVGPLREAIEGRRLSRRERNETLGDVASRSDPHVRERMRDQIDVASVAVGVLAEQMVVMAPILRQTLEDVERRVADAARGLPARPYDRDERDRDPRGRD